MRSFLDHLMRGLLLRLEIVVLFAGALIIGLLASDMLLWLGVSETASRGFGMIVWVVLFWMAGIWWIYLAVKNDMKTPEQGIVILDRSE